MHFSPSELKLVPLQDVPAGSLVQLVGRVDDIPFLLRLKDNPDSEKPRVLVLGGQYSFQVTTWSVADSPVWVVCPAEELRFRLNDPDEQTYRAGGALTLHTGGAYITTVPGQSSFPGMKIGLETWDAVNQNVGHNEFVVYPSWEVGTSDHNGDFVPLFQRQHQTT